MVLSIYPTVLALTLPRSRLWCCEAKPEFHFCNFCVACDLWNFHLLSTLCFLYHLFKVDFCVIMGKILTYSTCNIKSKSFFFNLFGGIRSHSSWMTKIRSADFSFRDCFFATLSSNNPICLHNSMCGHTSTFRYIYQFPRIFNVLWYKWKWFLSPWVC